MDVPKAVTVFKKVKKQTVRYQHANPLFDAWLREWQDQARQADSNMQFIFAKARQSLKKFPLPVYCGQDCKVLRFFGDKLCSMIDKRIRQHEADHGTIDWDAHITVRKGKVKACRVPASPAPSSSNGKRPKNRAVHQSAPSTKSCKASLALESEAINKPKSKTGRTNARSKRRVVAETPSDVPENLACSNSNLGGDLATNTSDKPLLFTLAPNSYSVVLCVDCAETTSKTNRAGIVQQLSEMGVVYDVRKLHVGDFTWVARENAPTGKAAREVILPCLVERKRMDDLASSIKDGRCREQKHRLHRSGVDATIYLVEAGGQHRVGLPLSTCHQAVANTAVVDGLLVKWTSGHRESAAHLALLTKLLQDAYQGKHVSALKSGVLPSPCPVGSCELVEFNAFNKSAVKNRQLSVREMLAKHLLQVSGLSVQKVAALVNQAPTPQALLALLNSTDGARELAAVRAGRSGRPVGIATVEAMARLYCDRQLR